MATSGSGRLHGRARGPARTLLASRSRLRAACRSTTHPGRVESLGLSGIALRDAAGALHQLRGEHTSLVEIDP